MGGPEERLGFSNSQFHQVVDCCLPRRELEGSGEVRTVQACSLGQFIKSQRICEVGMHIINRALDPESIPRICFEGRDCVAIGESDQTGGDAVEQAVCFELQHPRSSVAELEKQLFEQDFQGVVSKRSTMEIREVWKVFVECGSAVFFESLA